MTIIESLRISDLAFAYVEANNLPLERVRIDRITAKFIIDTKGHKYNGEDGKRVGDDRWSSHFLRVGSEYTAQYQRQQILTFLKKVEWETMSDEQLSAVAKIVKG